MKITSLTITDYKPIKHLSIENLGDTVIIAGANGSGKTRLKEAIIQTLQGKALVDMTIEATRTEEEGKYFAGKTLLIRKGQKNAVLNSYINSRKYGAGRYVGSFVQIDSNRGVQALTYKPVNWLGGDPDDTDTASNFYFTRFTDRWQDFVNYIHQKSAARDKKLADQLKKNPKDGEAIIQNNPDPLDKYKQIFSRVLPGKQLLDIDPASPKEFQYSDESGQTLAFSTLSSGELEVTKVLFDVARKDIRHSVIIVDEPELHLHPTLAFKLIETLKTIGGHTNQFMFLTHSADLISTYYSTGNVYFIDSSQSGSNQAHKLSDLNNSHRQLVQLIGQNLGLFAVGKKLVFVEGENSSIDRLTYHTIAQSIDTEIKVIPVGSVSNIMTLSAIEEQIRNAIFGIEMYMIRDRDGLNDTQISAIENNGRIRCLRRRHLENYFLDEEVLFKVAEQLYLTKTNPGITTELIKHETKRIAEESLNFNLLNNTKEHLGLNHFFKTPTVKSVDAKTTDEVKHEMIDGVNQSLGNLSNELEPSKFEDWLNKEEKELNDALLTEDWRVSFHGKLIFAKICSEVFKEDQVRIRTAYVDIALSEKPAIFADLIQIFNEVK